MNDYRMLIAGSWVEAGDRTAIDVINPATGSVIGRVPDASEADIDLALNAAATAAPGWRDLGGWQRSLILRRAATGLAERSEEMAARLTAEQGKPIGEALTEVAATVEQFDWFADEARRITGRIPESPNHALRYAVHREPVGPVAAFSPWNFPLLLAARKVAPALAAGCPMILRPPSEVPGPALILAEVLLDAGLPAGVLQMITGHPAPISERLLASPVIRKLSFTGSVPVGTHLLGLSARNVLNVSMELGGHAPVIVLGDVDPEATGRACAAGKFRNAGQICVSPTRFLVHESIAERFAAAFTDHAAQLRIGAGSDPETDIGPLISQSARDRIADLVADAIASGATTLLGGGSLPGDGFFVEPTVLFGVAPEAKIMREEPFGPVAPITAFRTTEEALALANATEFGLAAYLFTQDLNGAVLVSEQLQAGIVGVNTFAVSSAAIPFGGLKQSGIGAENGSEAMDAYLVSKSIVTQTTAPGG